MNAGIASIAVLISIGLGVAQGIEWYICVPIALIMLVVIFFISYWQHRDNVKSFKTADELRAGQLFRTAAGERRYQRFAEKHQPGSPKKDMKSDLIARYRSPAIALELLGALLLGLILIVLFAEEREGNGEPGVKYIVIGGIIILLYLAASGLFGLKARRFYLKLSDRPDYERLERSYMGSKIVGACGNAVSIGDEFITLITPGEIIPIKRADIILARRADVVGGTYFNGKAVGSDSEMYFINFYRNPDSPTAPQISKVHLSKLNVQLAFEALKESGIPTEESIDMR